MNGGGKGWGCSGEVVLKSLRDAGALGKEVMAANNRHVLTSGDRLRYKSYHN